MIERQLGESLADVNAACHDSDFFLREVFGYNFSE